MEINESKLRSLLSRRAKFIRTNKDIAESLLALAAYAVSVLLSGIKNADFSVKIIVAVLGFIYLVIFCFSIFRSRYSVETLFREIVSCSDSHNFSLVLLKNADGRFLLKYDKRWKTFLFPYTRTSKDDEKNVFEFVKVFTGITPLSVLKKVETDVTKYSVSAQIDKSYHHTFYHLDFKTEQTKEKFKFNGVTYKWFSIDEMKQNRSILEKNNETIRFVEENF